MTQEERWQSSYDEVVAFIKQNQRNVSKYSLDERAKISVGDREIRQHLLDGYGITDSIKVQELDKEKRNEVIISCLEKGAGMRQLSRLTGVTYGVINRLRGKRLVVKG